MKRFKKSDYLNGIDTLIKEKDYDTIRHYHLLKLKKLLGYKTFHIKSRNIGTQDKKITLNQEYQYREGSYLARAIVKKIKFKDFFLYVRLYLPDMDRTINLNHTMAIAAGYGGMWRIYDKDLWDMEKYLREEAAFERGEIDSFGPELSPGKFPP